MKKAVLLLALTFIFISLSEAQIYEPDGLNMPGDWDGWTNPPNNGVLRSSNISSGNITKITAGTTRWQSTIKVAASGGNITGGSYSFIFSSGPDGNRYANDWKSCNFSLNDINDLTFTTGGSNNTITVANGKWYVMNWKDAGYANTQAIFMELSGAPITFTSVSGNYTGAGNAVTVSISTSSAPAVEEKIYVRYTKDTWTTSNFVLATGSGTSWNATIPGGDVIGTSANQFYVLTTTVTTPTHANADMQTIKLSNNNGSNYTLPVELTSFNAIAKGKGVELAWHTATETNNYGFEVERKMSSLVSARDDDWSKIGFVEGNGTTNAPKSYSFVDNSATGTTSYRLKQIDRDGKFEYSQTVEVNVASAPKEFGLEQNYPNPFNPTTAIGYQLTANGFTSLKVYDAIGREVATLVNEVKDAGTYTAQFDGAKLSSGIYFAKLTSDNKTQIRKLLLMK